jgi:hypothetical protein
LGQIATSLGVNPSLIGSLARSIQAVQQGNIVNTFIDRLGVASVVPGISGSIDVAISFISTIIGFFGCDPSPVCPVNDHYSLYNGGSITSDAPSPANVADQTQKKLKEIGAVQ